MLNGKLNGKLFSIIRAFPRLRRGRATPGSAIASASPGGESAPAAAGAPSASLTRSRRAEKTARPALALIAALLLSGCPGDLLKQMDNPRDPQAPSYQGFSTVKAVDDLEAHTPEDGAEIVDPIFTVNELLDAESYRLQIATAPSFDDGSIIYDKDSFPERVFNVGISLTGGKSYSWRAAARKDGSWGKWTIPRAFRLTTTYTAWSPVDGSTTTDTTPTFTWKAMPGVSSYQICIADSAVKLDTSPSIDVTGVSYTPTSALTNLQAHYWRVRAKNGDGHYGAWSAINSLSVNWGTVSGLSPSDGVTTTDTTPALSWNAVPDAAGYELQIAGSEVGLANAQSVEVSRSSYTPTTALTNNTTHHWRVRAVDGDGQYGTWSAVQSLAVNIGVVSGLSPSDGITTTDTTPALSWNAVSGAAGYEVQIAGSEAGLASAQAVEVSAASYTPSTALTNNQNHYWRVRAKDGDGQFGAWSAINSLSVNWGTVGGLSPSDGVTTTDTTPALSWNAVSGAAGYEVQIAASEAGLASAQAVEVSGTSYTPSTALTNNQNHYWRVRAKDGDGQHGAWSAINSLSVNWGAVSGLSPADGATTTDTTPALSWNAVEGAAGYEVQIADSEAGLASAQSVEVSAASYTPTTALTNNTTHHWRVRAVDGDGQYGTWSAIQRLAVNIGAVSGLSPSDGITTTDTTPALSWNAVPGAAGYEVQIADSEAGVANAQAVEAGGTSYTPTTALTNNTTHHWRVRAKDGDGQYGIWSAINSLSVNWGTVSGLSPSSTTDTTPALSWNAVPGAAGYEVQIAASEGGLANSVAIDVTEASYTPATALTNLQTHYWRVRAKDGAGQYGAWSGVQSLGVFMLETVYVEGGSFQMGSTAGYSDEKPVHQVTVSTFYMSRYEVTHGHYLEFLNGAGVSAAGRLNGNEVIDMDDSDVAFSHNGTLFSFSGSEYADSIDCPVMEVTWYGAAEYANWLSAESSLTKVYTINGTSVTADWDANGYRLPTEAEWEYAARGGNASKGYLYAGSNNVGEVAWYEDNSGNETHPVGGKAPNELGLYDMSGNVREWCWDWDGSYSSGSQSDPRGPASGSNRVFRGGSWINSAWYLRSANRSSFSPGNSIYYLGFRLVRREF